MASGIINGTTSSQYCISKIEWHSELNADENESKVTATLFLKRTNNVNTTGQEWAFEILIDGNKTSVSGKPLTVSNEWIEAMTATVTVPHNSDGFKSVVISASGGNPDTSVHSISCSGTAVLDTIPKASTFDYLACASEYFTGIITLKYTPQSAEYYNVFSVDLKMSESLEPIARLNLGKMPAAQQTYTMLLEDYWLSLVYNNLPDTDTGTLCFTLQTFSDSDCYTQIGESIEKEITLYIPEDDTTKPTVEMALSPVGNDLYIQGLSSVQAVFTNGTGKYGAIITGYKMKVGGVEYEDPYTSGILSTSGEVEVTGIVTDSRGFKNECKQVITVIAYDKPKLLNTEAFRCDENGNPKDDGTYLRIKAKRSYYKVMSGDEQINFCKIQYRYKAAEGTEYSDWSIILEDNAEDDEVITAALLNGGLSKESTYEVQIQAIDAMGGLAGESIMVPSEKIYWHRDGKRRSFTFGGYVEEPNTFAITEDISFRAKGGIGALGSYEGEDFHALINRTGYYYGTKAPASAGCINYLVDKPGILYVTAIKDVKAHLQYCTDDGEKYFQSWTPDGWSAIVQL